MNPENTYKSCPHCQKLPPRNFEDFDTCYGAYQFEKEYRVEVLSFDNNDPGEYQDGFKCEGQARDWVNKNYPDRDWNLGKV